MSLDISGILDDWPYESGHVMARRIRGDDGRDKIQLRLDLGVLQMETAGRPDGRRPHGQESLLVHYEQQLQQHIERHGSGEGFELDERACELLRAEGVMYYHRYLAAFVLEEYGIVIRDSKRNLRMFDLCSTYAKEESDRHILEQYRPYVIMMGARGKGMMSLKDNRPKTALAAVQKGIDDIRLFYQQFGQEDAFEACGEVAILRGLGKEIEARIPVDPLKKLRGELAKAVDEERYEEAASLRDQLRRATEQLSHNSE